jgi:hypothetical protein
MKVVVSVSTSVANTVVPEGMWNNKYAGITMSLEGPGTRRKTIESLVLD